MAYTEKELKFKRIWEKRARTTTPERVVFGYYTKRWSPVEDVRTFENIMKLLSVENGTAILDIGCGPLARAEVQFSTKNFEIVGADISSTSLKIAKQFVEQ